MSHKNYNSVDPKTGTVTYRGPSEITKGNHSHMPSRTEAYLETDERGHIQASSLGGYNNRNNVVPQSADLNHGGYYSMEQGERTALKNGSTVQSEKIAYASVQSGSRPDAFMVNDTITYADGKTQNIHLSFANMTNAQQEGVNAESVVQCTDMFAEYANPEDTLRENIPTAEYTELMEETDTILPNISDMFDEHVSASSISVEETAEWDFDTVVESSAESGVDCVCDNSVEVDSADISSSDDEVSASMDDD